MGPTSHHLTPKQYSKPMTLPLDDIAIVLLPDTDDMRNAWQITSTKRSFTLFAATSRERGEWVQHLAQASGCPLITNPGADTAKLLVALALALTLRALRLHLTLAPPLPSCACCPPLQRTACRRMRRHGCRTTTPRSACTAAAWAG